MLNQKEAEQGLVYGLVKRNGENSEDALARLANLPVALMAEKIGDAKLRELYNVIRQNADEGIATSITLAARLSGIDEFTLTAETAVIDTDAIGIYADTVLYWWKKRLVQQVTTEAQETARVLEPQAAVDTITTRLAALDLADEDDVVQTVTERTEIGCQRLAEIHDDFKNGVPRISFCMKKLNELVPLLFPGDVVLITAQSKAGKSSWLQGQFDYLVRRGFRGIMFHLEDTPEKITIRRLARHMTRFLNSKWEPRYPNIPDYNRLMGKSHGEVGYALTDEEWAVVNQVKQIIADELGDRGIEIHCPGWRVEQIVSVWQRLHDRERQAGGKIDFVCVDYLNKLEWPSEWEAAVGQANALGRGLEIIKRMAERLGTVAFVVQQENDAGQTYNSRQTLQKAQVWLSIRRERLGDQRLDTKGQIVVCAANFGETGAVSVELKPRWMLWQEL